MEATNPVLSSDPSARAARVLWLVLITMTASRALLTLDHSMWAWGLNLLRFLPPLPGWALWAVGALALVPALSRRLEPGFSRVGQTIVRSPARAALVSAAVCVALLGVLPDRAWFTGDFSIRNDVVASGKDFASVFPESMPLDVFLHATLPRAIKHLGWLDTNGALRLIGLVEVSALAHLAIQFAREMTGEGIEALVAVAIALGGGYLTMFTGFAKCAGELCLVTMVFTWGALRVVRGKPGLPPRAFSIAAGLTLHRAALILVPAFVALIPFAVRSDLEDGAWRRPEVVLAGVALVASLSSLPKMISIIVSYDLPHHFASATVLEEGGLMGSMLAGLRPLDLANAAIFFSPLAAALPFVAVTVGGRVWRQPETLVLAGISLCFTGAALLMHPQQGLMRDLDVIAPAGIALALLTAWFIIGALRMAPSWRWLAVPASLAAVTATSQWLIHDHSVAEGLRRAEAFATEAPHRPEIELGHLWLYIGDRNAQLKEWPACARAMARAAAFQPSPRVLSRWAIAETNADNQEGARTAWVTLITRSPLDASGWKHLTITDIRLGRSEEALWAARQLVRMRPRDSVAVGLLESAERLISRGNR